MCIFHSRAKDPAATGAKFPKKRAPNPFKMVVFLPPTTWLEWCSTIAACCNTYYMENFYHPKNDRFPKPTTPFTPQTVTHRVLVATFTGVTKKKAEGPSAASGQVGAAAPAPAPSPTGHYPFHDTLLTTAAPEIKGVVEGLPEVLVVGHMPVVPALRFFLRNLGVQQPKDLVVPPRCIVYGSGGPSLAQAACLEGFDTVVLEGNAVLARFTRRLLKACALINMGTYNGTPDPSKLNIADETTPIASIGKDLFRHRIGEKTPYVAGMSPNVDGTMGNELVFSAMTSRMSWRRTEVCALFFSMYVLCVGVGIS